MATRAFGLAEQGTAYKLCFIVVLTLSSFLCRPFKERTNAPEFQYKVDYYMVAFSDRDFPATRTKGYYEELIFKGDNSVNRYIEKSSFGKATLTGGVAGPIELRQSYRRGKRSQREYVSALLEELQTKVKTNGGHIGLILPLAPNELWPHFHSYYDRPQDAIMIFNGAARLGAFVHELGHSLGLPDLYDGDGPKLNINKWCAMADGAALDHQDTPSDFSGWAKSKLGWTRPVTVEPAPLTSKQTYRFTKNESPAQLLRIPVAVGSQPEGQAQVIGRYLLVEFRGASGQDRFLPGPAVLVYSVAEYAGTTDTVELPAGSILQNKNAVYIFNVSGGGKVGITLLSLTKTGATISVKRH